MQWCARDADTIQGDASLSYKVKSSLAILCFSLICITTPYVLMNFSDSSSSGIIIFEHWIKHNIILFVRKDYQTTLMSSLH